MRDQLDQYYLQQPEPNRACLLAVRDHILDYDSDISEAWKYHMPSFCYRGKMLWYLRSMRKTQQPYLGVVLGKAIDHPLLLQEDRVRMKILQLDPTGDLPWEPIDFVLQKSIALCRK